VIQRLKDADDVDITLGRIASENNVVTLRAWLALTENLDWDDDDKELAGPIEERIAALGQQAKEDEEQDAARLEAEEQARTLELERAKIRKKLEKHAGGPLKNFDAVVQEQISTLPQHVQASFFTVCQDEGLNPSAVLDAVPSGEGWKVGMTCFADGHPLQTAINLSTQYPKLKGMTRTTGGLTKLICELITDGILSVHKSTYTDNPMVKGSVFTFNIVLTGGRITPEWHVHWAPGNKVHAASYKNFNDRKKTGKGVRTVTGQVEIADLRNVIPKVVWN
jgi:hypothetical protein